MLKKILLILAGLLAVLFIAYKVLQSTTKKASPEVNQTFELGGAQMKVFYCQPSKNGREIFGKLLPYGEVWRTGANEPTTIETNKDISVQGKTLPAGKYSLWTIPQQNSWTIILNSEVPGWGVSWGGKAARDAAKDVLQVEAPVATLPAVQEKLQIDVQAAALRIAWDNVEVKVPVTVQ
jgi:Protein of unknown function (DUF2911)